MRELPEPELDLRLSFSGRTASETSFCAAARNATTAVNADAIYDDRYETVPPLSS